MTVCMGGGFNNGVWGIECSDFRGTTEKTWSLILECSGTCYHDSKGNKRVGK